MTGNDPLARLPHGPGARMVYEIVELRAEEIHCRARIDPSGPYVEAGHYPAYVLFEAAAQGSALLELAGSGPDGPSRGYLVRLRDGRCTKPRLPVDGSVDVHVRRCGAAGAVRRYDARILRAGDEVFAGSFTTYLDAAVPTDS